MNRLFLLMILAAFAAAAAGQLHWSGAVGAGPMTDLATAATTAAAQAVTVAIGLIGVMALFLGILKVAETAGLLHLLAAALAPVMRRLFPQVPPDHPAMGAMILNFSANLLGLGNAATPFGLRAMQELDRLNPARGWASEAMVLFLGLNTAGLSLIPAKVVALRASVGSHNPASIIAATLVTSAVATVAAILAARTLGRFWPIPADALGGAGIKEETAAPSPSAAGEGIALGRLPVWAGPAVLLGLAALIVGTVASGGRLSPWILPGFMAGMLGFGALRGVAVYDTFIEGAREGFDVAVRIIPPLVAILVAVGMLRSSGALDWLLAQVGVVTGPLGLPPQALLLAVTRTLSGAGAYGLLAGDLADPAIGPDSPLGRLLSTLYGSTETTFYVLAVYFGAVRIRRLRHAVLTGLIADAVAVATAVTINHWGL